MEDPFDFDDNVVDFDASVFDNNEEIYDRHNSMNSSTLGIGLGFADELYSTRKYNEENEEDAQCISAKDYKYESDSTKSRSPSGFNVFVAESIYERVGDDPKFLEKIYHKFSHSKEVLGKLQQSLDKIGISYDTFLEKLITNYRHNRINYDIPSDIRSLRSNIANDLLKLTEMSILKPHKDFKDIILDLNIELCTPQIRRLRGDIYDSKDSSII